MPEDPRIGSGFPPSGSTLRMKWDLAAAHVFGDGDWMLRKWL